MYVVVLFARRGWGSSSASEGCKGAAAALANLGAFADLH